MEYYLFGYFLQYLFAGVGMWQMIAGSGLLGVIILLLVISSDIMFHNNKSKIAN